MCIRDRCGRLGVSRKLRDEVVRQLLLLAEDGLVGEMPGLRFRALDRGKGKGEKSGRAKGRRTKDEGGSRKRSRRTIEEKPTAAPPVLAGKLTMTTQGYGFVNVLDGSPDVFVPPDGVGPALHGDKVQVRVRPSRKGREGSVVGVVERRPGRMPWDPRGEVPQSAEVEQ